MNDPTLRPAAGGAPGQGHAEARLQRVERDLEAGLHALDGRAAIPFNRMAEWGADGRIVPGAPVHSPFIRRTRDLALE